MRIATWNMQGMQYSNGAFSTYSEAKIRMQRYDIDVLCLQESGDLSSLGLPLYNTHFGLQIYQDILGTQSRGEPILVYFFRNGRCSLATLVKPSLLYNNYWQPLPYYILMSNGLAPRPVFGVCVNHAGRCLRIYNMHSIASHRASEYNARVINFLRQPRVGYVISYLLAGDFNIDPQSLSTYLGSSAAPFNPPFNLLQPNEFTHIHGKELDYFESNCVGRANVRIPTDNVAYSDHRIVIMDI